jgi:hypothetical protein
MKKVKSLGAPRRGVVWTASPATSEFPDSSDYDNTYEANPESVKRPTAAPAAPRFTPTERERRTSFAAFLQNALFRHMVWG